MANWTEKTKENHTPQKIRAAHSGWLQQKFIFRKTPWTGHSTNWKAIWKKVSAIG